eukprot:c20307_g1_i2.p1 GENE.c20307_g1_i2~~c20307_g1_i2.p1  ORF type:complete len:721 (+),score=281.64 c20307_g1_i2:1-2163(+)
MSSRPFGIIGLFVIISLCCCAVFWIVDHSIEILSDLRRGYCSSNPFLTRVDCCYSTSTTTSAYRIHCDDWKSWSTIWKSDDANDITGYAIYVLSSFVCCVLAAYLVTKCQTFTGSSGITEIRLILGGFEHKPLLEPQLLLTRLIGVILSVGGGLSLGSEGPMVHISCCIANIYWNLFQSNIKLDVTKKEVLTAASSIAIAVAFNAPIAGVIFTLEETSPCFLGRSMLFSLACSVFSCVLFQFLDVGQHFEVSYTFAVHTFETPGFVLLGIICGIFGSFLVTLNSFISTKIFSWRKQTVVQRTRSIIEVGILSLISSFIRYWNPYTRSNQPHLLDHLFSECATVNERDWHGLCSQHLVFQEIWLLTTAAMIIFILTALIYGSVLPGEVITPALCIGACLGRAWGIFIQHIQYVNSDLLIFGQCRTTNRCITPGVYAMVGAASLVCSVTHTPLTIIILMFELTGQLHYTLPLLLGVLASKVISERIQKLSIWDSYTKIWSYPHIDIHKELTEFIPKESFKNITAASLMIGSNTGLSWAHEQQLKDHFMSIIVIETRNHTINDILNLCEKNVFYGYPIITTKNERYLVGYIKRNDLIKRIHHSLGSDDFNKNTFVSFQNRTLLDNDERILINQSFIDLSDLVDTAPMLIEWSTPFQRLYDIFKLLSLQYVMVMSHGKFCGILKRKDVLNYLKEHEQSLYVNSTTRRNGQQQESQEMFELHLES